MDSFRIWRFEFSVKEWLRQPRTYPSKEAAWIEIARLDKLYGGNFEVWRCPVDC